MSFIRLILFFALIFGLTLLVQKASSEPGMVVVQWFGYEIATSGAVAAAAGIILVCAVFYAGIVWSWLTYVPVWVQSMRAKRKQAKGLDDLEKALDALAAGDAETVRKMGLRVAHALPEKKLGTYLLSAAADLEPHQLIGLPMLPYSDSSAFATLRGRVAQAVVDGDMKEARKLASDALELRPNSPWALDKVFELAIAAHDNEKCFELLPRLRKHNVRDPEELDRHEIGLRFEIAQGMVGTDDRQALKLVEDGLKSFPESKRLGRLHADLLVKLGKNKAAIKELERLWQMQPDDVLFNDWLKLHKGIPNQKLFKLVDKLAAGQADGASADHVLRLTHEYLQERAVA